MASSDVARLYRIYGGSVVDVDLPLATPILITAKGPEKIVTVLGIIFEPSVAGSGTLTFSDSLTGKTICRLVLMPDSLGSGKAELTRTFGASGTSLSAGANLLLGTTSDVPAGRLHLDAYQKGH